MDIDAGLFHSASLLFLVISISFSNIIFTLVYIYPPGKLSETFLCHTPYKL